MQFRPSNDHNLRLNWLTSKLSRYHQSQTRTRSQLRDDTSNTLTRLRNILFDLNQRVGTFNWTNMTVLLIDRGVVIYSKT